jgi:hypothetical protein
LAQRVPRDSPALKVPQALPVKLEPPEPRDQQVSRAQLDLRVPRELLALRV